MPMIKRGDRIVWERCVYRGNSVVFVVKHGVYLGMMKHTKRHWLKPEAVQMVRIKCDGRDVFKVVRQSEVHREKDS